MDAPLKKRKLTFESELDDGGGSYDVDSINERDVPPTRVAFILQPRRPGVAHPSGRLGGKSTERAWRARSNPAQ